jgi:hypothetical protein
MIKRQEICDVLEAQLSNISTANGYSIDFDKITYWQGTETEYSKNHLNFRDESEDYEQTNTRYDASLSVVIEAVVIETGSLSAPKMGTLALKDVMVAVKNCSLPTTLFNFKRSHKYVETKGKTAALIELEVEVLYKF